MSLKKEEIEDILSTTSGSEEESEEPVVHKPKKMSDKITLAFLTKFIKPYSGNRESLPAFLTNCENAISLASTDQQNVLCKYIISQLEGKAQIACCLKKFNSWSDIKTFLKATFGEKKHSTHLLLDLQNCKQLPSEDVMQYSLRIESCLTRLQSDIQHSCEVDSELSGRIAAMEDLALNTFLLGLNTGFSHIVRCRNPKSLSDAISHAIEEEKLYKLTKMSNRSFIKQCSICNKSGHVASECYKNKSTKHSTPNFHHINNTNFHNKDKNNTNYQQNSNSNFDSNKLCAYCKYRGHMIGECRKLKFKYNSNTRNDPRNPTLSSAQAPTSSNLPSNNRSNVHTVDFCNDSDSALN